MQLSTEEFIKLSKAVTGDQYNYSKTVYKNSKDKICIICPEHGEFWQRPDHHLKGHGCRKCAGRKISQTKSLGQEEFIYRGNKIYTGFYDYTKVNYKNRNTNVCIICPEHGEFWQCPDSHLQGVGCKKCSGREQLNTESFIERGKKKHGDKYSYEKTKFINRATKVVITCPIEEL